MLVSASALWHSPSLGVLASASVLWHSPSLCVLAGVSVLWHSPSLGVYADVSVLWQPKPWCSCWCQHVFCLWQGLKVKGLTAAPLNLKIQIFYFLKYITDILTDFGHVFMGIFSLILDRSCWYHHQTFHQKLALKCMMLLCSLCQTGLQ